MASTKVLMLDMLSNFGTREFIEYTADRYHNCIFFFSTPPTPGESWDVTYLDCVQKVRDLGIDVAVAVCDRGAVILAALAAEFPHIKSSSFEGFHVTYDKTITRELIIPNKYSLPFYSLSIDAMKTSVPTGSIIDTVGLPAIAKPANGTGSQLIKTLHTRQDFDDLSSDYFIKNTQGMLQPLQSLIKTFLDCDRYKCALTPKLIIEQYIDRTQGGISISTVDGLVCNGKLKRWVASDNRYWESRPDALKCLTIPSALPAHVQENAWECLQIIVDKLKPYGFDNQFLDVEFFAFPDGRIKVMEINGRMFNMMNYLCDAMLENGNQYKAMIDVALGIDVPEPQIKSNLFGMYTYLNVFKTGRVGDFINFDRIPEITSAKFIVRSSAEERVVEPGANGFFAGAACLLGTSFEDCCRQMHEMKHKIFKRTDVSPWFDEKA